MAAGAGALWGSGDAQASTAGPRAVFRFSGSHGLLWRRGRPGVNRRLLLREPWAAEPNKVRMSRAIGALPQRKEDQEEEMDKETACRVVACISSQK